MYFGQLLLTVRLIACIINQKPFIMTLKIYICSICTFKILCSWVGLACRFKANCLIVAPGPIGGGALDALCSWISLE